MRTGWFVAVVFVLGCSGNIEAPAPAAVSDGDSGNSSETRVDPTGDPGEPADPGAGEEGSGDDAGVLAETGVDSDAGELPSDAGTTSKSASSIFAAEAVRELAAMKESTYSHTTHVDESTGTFDYDCSGFVDYALGRVLPDRLKTVETQQGVTRPLAKHYEQFFATLDTTGKGGWKRVTRAIDLDAGDVIAWLKPADVVSSNTGHVLVARGKATVNPKKSDEILVPITDSTSSYHGSTDSRYPSGQGLGTGTIGILVDAKGAPIGYRWTGGVSTKLEYTSVALGRLDG